jgi:hypothetical protein
MTEAISVTTNPTTIYKIPNFHPIGDLIKKFNDVYLYEIISSLGKTQFLDKAIKYCWHLTYNDLNLTVKPAKENCYNMTTSDHTKNYLSQQMHSISGEQNDLCLYTYGYEDLNTFLQINKDRHYTFLPITVHATESANGIRHDMLVIFNNRTKHFYWLDGNNRSDYLSFGKNTPRDAIDTLFINFAELAKTGYDYEPSQSWQFPGIFRDYGSITRQLDFILSTAWCYLTILMIDDYNTPMEFLSMLDGLSEVDRFHLLYCTMIQLINCPMSMFSGESDQHISANDNVNTTVDQLSHLSKLNLDSSESTTEFKMTEPPRIVNLVDDVGYVSDSDILRVYTAQYKLNLQRLTDQENEYDANFRRTQRQMHQDNLVNPDPEYEDKLRQLHRDEYTHTTNLRKKRQEYYEEYKKYIEQYGNKHCYSEEGIKIIGPIKVVESDEAKPTNVKLTDKQINAEMIEIFKKVGIDAEYTSPKSDVHDDHDPLTLVNPDVRTKQASTRNDDSSDSDSNDGDGRCLIV